MVLFFNYLLKIIDQSKPPFTTQDFLNKIFDPDFVEDEKYANLLVKNIPEKKKFEVFVEMYRQKEKGDGRKLRFFVSELLKIFEQEEMEKVFKFISEELNNTTEPETFRFILQIRPSSCWEYFDEVGRHRIENKLIKSIQDGRYSEESQKLFSGGFGTWVTKIPSRHLLRKSNLRWAILNNLKNSDRTRQDYVFNYLFTYFIEITDPPSEGIVETVKKGLDRGDVRYYDALLGVMAWGFSESWKKAFKEAYDNFTEATQEQQETKGEEDIPF